MKGIISHYATFDSFSKVSNLESLIDYINDREYTFILLIFGDLKNYTFSYSLCEINNQVEYKIKKISSFDKLSPESKSSIQEVYKSIKSENVLNFYSTNLVNDYIFIYDINNAFHNLPSFLKNSIKLNKATSMQMIIVKDYSQIEKSILLNIEDIIIDTSNTFECKNLKIYTSDLKQIFDAKTIAENAVDLNINLMKWKMAPDLDTNIIKNTKFLLIGAGTLGCHVSRNLLGWGARNINFIDCGKISYSNPVRQSLYTFLDSSNDKNLKAEVAATKLKEIFPMVNSEGYYLSIPLPSRPLTNKECEDAFFKSIEQLEKIISEHDYIFLLTDSRESRWFPTLIAKAQNKSIITAAIGFDSFLIMKHGVSNNNLGCYFCGDIVSPVDTSANRTLDQQCTISRPGISAICSGLACELAIATLQNGNSIGYNVPKSIRGNLSDYSFLSIDHSSFIK
jgi:molybdopterin/thiamine biosynthesis adenylyltransferase